ncbi:hypothetical protein JCM10207_004143 [Rhodosporidiobolus poonsookiae]
MFFSRLTAVSLLALASTSLARPTNPADSALDLARRSNEALVGDWASLEKRDMNEVEVERRAVEGLMRDLAELEKRSAGPEGLYKRGEHCSGSGSGETHSTTSKAPASTSKAPATTSKAASTTKKTTTSAPAQSTSSGEGCKKNCGSSGSGTGSGSGEATIIVEIRGHASTCIGKIKGIGGSISTGVKGCGSNPSAYQVVGVVKGHLGELRGAISTFASACVGLRAKGGVGLTVEIVASLIVEILVAVHAALLEIITLAARLPFLIALLAGELLAISAQLVIALNACIGLVGWELKAALQAKLSATVVGGFKTCGMWGLVGVIGF